MSYVTISDSLRKLILYQAGSTKRCNFMSTIHSDHFSALNHRPPLDGECELPTIMKCVSTEIPVVLYGRSIIGSERLSLKLRGSAVIYAGNTAFNPADFYPANKHSRTRRRYPDRPSAMVFREVTGQNLSSWTRVSWGSAV